jgi:hypothetical protein
MGLLLLGGMIFMAGIYLIAFVGAGVLWYRSRTTPTAMFFFGAITAILPMLASLLLLQSKLVGSSINIMAYSALFSYIGMAVAAIGLLLFALSLPKKS